MEIVRWKEEPASPIIPMIIPVPWRYSTNPIFITAWHQASDGPKIPALLHPVLTLVFFRTPHPHPIPHVLKRSFLLLAPATTPHNNEATTGPWRAPLFTVYSVPALKPCRAPGSAVQTISMTLHAPHIYNSSLVPGRPGPDADSVRSRVPESIQSQSSNLLLYVHRGGKTPKRCSAFDTCNIYCHLSTHSSLK
ncbi:hypothetical protein RRG08_027066 [Elysia crispata]|uniref:Uncharacterized protein n=1 Tax=Elysia crispata TaxID=231223 RepID=A0AAE0ZJB3_9GAST|nr:hypothetical protein RRG08_027066 [Elysia crispata]